MNSLYLEINGDGQQRKEYLKLSVFKKPKDHLEKFHNEETMRQAKQQAATRQLELQASRLGQEYIKASTLSFPAFLDEFKANYPNQDLNKIKGAITHLQDYLNGASFALNQNLVDRLKRYLTDDAGLSGETPFMYFQIIKRICKAAHRAGVLKVNPEHLSWKMKRSEASVEKEVLTIEELNKLASKPCGNETVKRMFLFCCNVGLRLGDARKLTWADIRNYRIGIEQGKTGIKLYSRLNPNARKAAGPEGPANQLVFDMDITSDGVNKVLKGWYKRAHINKHITTHCARHTFCTMLMQNNVNSRTIIGLMGWSKESGQRYLNRYAHLVDETVQAAVDTLPTIEF